MCTKHPKEHPCITQETNTFSHTNHFLIRWESYVICTWSWSTPTGPRTAVSGSPLVAGLTLGPGTLGPRKSNDEMSKFILLNHNIFTPPPQKKSLNKSDLYTHFTYIIYATGNHWEQSILISSSLPYILSHLHLPITTPMFTIVSHFTSYDSTGVYLIHCLTTSLYYDSTRFEVNQLSNLSLNNGSTLFSLEYNHLTYPFTLILCFFKLYSSNPLFKYFPKTSPSQFFCSRSIVSLCPSVGD